MGGRLLALVVGLGLMLSVTGGCAPSSVPTVAAFTIAVPAPVSYGAKTSGLGMQRGALLAVDDMNASQEAKDLKIRFTGVPTDDRDDVKTGEAIATGLVSDPRLVGVVGHLDSTVSVAASKIYNQYQIVQISPASVDPILTSQGFRNVFRVCPLGSIQGPRGADDAIRRFGWKSAFVVDDATPYGKGLAASFSKEFAAKGGKVLGTATVSEDTTKPTSVVEAITSDAPEVIYFGGDRRAGAFLAAGVEAAGLKAPVMGADRLRDPEFIKIAGAASAEGAFATSLFLPLEQMRLGQRFESVYQKRYPGKQIETYDAYAYDAATVIMKAVFKVAKEKGVEKVATTEGRKAIMEQVAKTDLEGVTGRVSFDDKGDTTNQTTVLYTVSRGSWVPYTK